MQAEPTLRALRDRPFELLLALETRARDAAAGAREGAAAQEWIGVAFRMGGETFLVERLGFGWEEVHEVAEQMEHVSSDKLIQKLDDYLGHPPFDPHGEPIPRRNGALKAASLKHLGQLRKGESARVAGVNDRSPEFLRFLTRHRIALGSTVRITGRNEHDGSISITAGGRTVLLGQASAHNILVAP